MQRHNPDSPQHTSGNAHLFESPAAGVWALRSDADQLGDDAPDQAMTSAAKAVAQIGAEANA
jgi:hypothetical protein